MTTQKVRIRRAVRTAALCAVALVAVTPGSALADWEDEYSYANDALLAADIAYADAQAEEAPAGFAARSLAAAGVLSAHAAAPAKLWYNGVEVTSGFYASSGDPAVPRYSAVMCGIYSAEGIPAGGDATGLFTMPTSHTRADPCGPGGRRVGSSHITSGSEVTPDSPDGQIVSTFPNKPANGLWGLYAVAIGPNNTVSELPTEVDTVLGIDKVAPTVSLTAPATGFHATTATVALTFTAADQPTLSGVAATECRNTLPAETAWAPCASGAPFALSAGNGPKRIELRVTDAAGNTASTAVEGDATFSNETTLALTGAPTVYGAAATLTATVSSAGPVATGTVTFSEGSTILGTGTLNGTGQASISVNTLSVGSHAVTATYAGDATHSGSTGTYTQVVSKAGSKLVAEGAHLRIAQLSVTFSARLTAGDGSPLAGKTVSMARNGIVYCTAVTDANGEAACSTRRLTVELLAWVILGGKYDATYAGDANRTGSSDRSDRAWLSLC
ncbi:Ig-like domain repeat protein [Longispora sp. NPDC051575]|uniref:Ig-like domain-containing protein n=1 Tax=Longispora sp. NPDC051575 TaxID=3154943 RepID=UPI003425F272